MTNEYGSMCDGAAPSTLRPMPMEASEGFCVAGASEEETAPTAVAPTSADDPNMDSTARLTGVDTDTGVAAGERHNSDAASPLLRGGGRAVTSLCACCAYTPASAARQLKKSRSNV